MTSSSLRRFIGLVALLCVAAGADARDIPALSSSVHFFGNGTSSDYAVWRPTTGVWYAIDGKGNSLSQQWGENGDVLVPGDYDGDGKTDVAVWRPSTGTWYIVQSSNGQLVTKQWGASTDIPVVGDFDGDGKADIAVWRPSTGVWYIIQSSNGQLLTKQWGAPTDIPVVGDFDGDGKADIAVWRPSNGTWYIVQSSNGQLASPQWGESGDVLVPGDYDGDGKTDVAVWRPSSGSWYIVQSSNAQVVARQWGESGDVPVPGDYDGDGKTDIGVWRPSSGTWYIIQSSNGQLASQQWGASTDIPISSSNHSFTTSVLYSFAGGPADGSGPDNSLTQGSDGNFYGNTHDGGTNNTGTVFRVTPAGVETVLYSFGTTASHDATSPYGSLILGADGNFYGTTGTGGTSGNGTVFKVTPAGVESVVYSFAGGTADGSRPNSMIQGSDGNFYGTTPNGGAHGGGIVFKLTPTGVETVLYSFAGGAGDGSTPEARLVQATDGNFYGTTSAGGPSNAGTVFQITSAGVETVLYTFGTQANDGIAPDASLIQASDGNFYSTTFNGGTNNLGTVFRITPAGVETVLYSFGTNAGDGTNPFARLYQGSDGNLYGTTPDGGAYGLGVVFKITLSGAESLVYTFTGDPDGAYPQNSLIQGSDGNFYGTTNQGGANNLGTVFKIFRQ